MQRFFLPAAQARGDTLVLSDREAHHALHVVRLRPGEIVEVLDGEGARLRCETVGFARREVTLRVVQRDATPPRAWPITLIQAVPKGKTFDTIVQKATELGVHRIVPLLSQRVVAQIETDRAATKLEHWRAIAIESIKQCGSPWVPVLDPPTSFRDLLTRLGPRPEPVEGPAPLRLVASLRPDARHPRTVLDSLTGRGAGAGARPPGGGPVHMWVGPEGDFTDEELDCLQTAGVQPITLGPLVLRADTAAIYCLSILNCALT
jgi:16S rRNA (uracil1498-N3)-methyltransferase